MALKKCFNAFASSSDAQRTYREISYLLKLRGHVNVVQLMHVIRAKHDLDIYLVRATAAPSLKASPRERRGPRRVGRVLRLTPGPPVL